jgi:hypothetical protein
MGIVMTEWRVSLPCCQMQNLWFYRFYHHHFGTEIWIPCQAPFHVHLLCISCSRYGLLYIGKIERSLKIRFGEHRHAVIGNNANQPIATYFDTGIHSVSDIEIRTICPISGSNDRHKRYEMRLISKLGTIHP